MPFSITISKEEYKLGSKNWKNNLHGHFILAKGDQPFHYQDLHAKLTKLWKPLGDWCMTPQDKDSMNSASPQQMICIAFGLLELGTFSPGSSTYINGLLILIPTSRNSPILNVGLTYVTYPKNIGGPRPS